MVNHSCNSKTQETEAETEGSLAVGGQRGVNSELKTMWYNPVSNKNKSKHRKTKNDNEINCSNKEHFIIFKELNTFLFK